MVVLIVRALLPGVYIAAPDLETSMYLKFSWPVLLYSMDERLKTISRFVSGIWFFDFKNGPAFSLLARYEKCL